MLRLVEAVETALGQLAQEVHKDASVVVQFAAGDWAKLKEAVKAARASLSEESKHHIADAAGVVSHTTSGQPIPADVRIVAALDVIEDKVTESGAQSEPESQGGQSHES